MTGQNQIRFLIENYYDIQKLRIQTFGRIVAYVKSNFEKFEDIETPEQNKHSYVAELICREKIPIPNDIVDLVWFYRELYDTEKQLYKKIDEFSKDHLYRVRYLNNIKGIGPVFASGIIAWLAPLSRFATVSKLWKYCGLAPGSVRRRGKMCDYNPKLKTFMWRMGESFIKQKSRGGFYGMMYERFKQECQQKHPDWSKGHVHAWARRKIVKLFLSHAWEMWWRLMEGREPPTKPYAQEHLKHVDYYRPVMDKLERVR